MATTTATRTQPAKPAKVKKTRAKPYDPLAGLTLNDTHLVLMRNSMNSPGVTKGYLNLRGRELGNVTIDVRSAPASDRRDRGNVIDLTEATVKPNCTVTITVTEDDSRADKLIVIANGLRARGSTLSVQSPGSSIRLAGFIAHDATIGNLDMGICTSMLSLAGSRVNRLTFNGMEIKKLCCNEAKVHRLVVNVETAISRASFLGMRCACYESSGSLPQINSAAVDSAFFKRATRSVLETLARLPHEFEGAYRLPIDDDRGYLPIVLFGEGDRIGEKGWRVLSGCRDFTLAQGIEHWTKRANERTADEPSLSRSGLRDVLRWRLYAEALKTLAERADTLPKPVPRDPAKIGEIAKMRVRAKTARADAEAMVAAADAAFFARPELD